MMILRLTTDEDLSILISWINDKDACRLWAGPQVRFPLSLDSLKEDINFSEENTFSMINDEGEFWGLGQLIEKENGRIHLARLIISPIQRGQGFGNLLCRLLIDAAGDRFGKVNLSLNVYSKNTKAVRLYEKLGFKRTLDSPDSSGDQTSVHMILKPNHKAADSE
jgi:ribosomal protein S18 acetylase RimI-like enzyme